MGEEASASAIAMNGAANRNSFLRYSHISHHHLFGDAVDEDLIHHAYDPT